MLLDIDIEMGDHEETIILLCKNGHVSCGEGFFLPGGGGNNADADA